MDSETPPEISKEQSDSKNESELAKFQKELQRVQDYFTPGYPMDGTWNERSAYWSDRSKKTDQQIEEEAASNRNLSEGQKLRKQATGTAFGFENRKEVVKDVYKKNKELIAQNKDTTALDGIPRFGRSFTAAEAKEIVEKKQVSKDEKRFGNPELYDQYTPTRKSQSVKTDEKDIAQAPQAQPNITRPLPVSEAQIKNAATKMEELRDRLGSKKKVDAEKTTNKENIRKFQSATLIQFMDRAKQLQKSSNTGPDKVATKG